MWDVEGDRQEVILLANFSIFEVGDERRVYFLEDKWYGKEPLYVIPLAL